MLAVDKILVHKDVKSRTLSESVISNAYI